MVDPDVLGSQSWKERHTFGPTPKQETEGWRGFIEAFTHKEWQGLRPLCHARVLSGDPHATRHPAMGHQRSIPHSGKEVLSADCVLGTELNTVLAGH